MTGARVPGAGGTAPPLAAPIPAVLIALALGGAGAGVPCAAAAPVPSDLEPIQPGLDYHSFANTDQFQVTHLQIELRIDLDHQEIDGVVGLKVKRLDPRATQLILDTKDLMIQGVSQKAGEVLGATEKGQGKSDWVSRPFHLDKPDPILGSALVIDLPPSARTTELVRIEYETQPGAAALQWLTPKQTASHKPFLYTQAEPIGARSWIPLPDTPAVRMTYDAVIHTSPGVAVVMSARNDPKHKRNGEYLFEMPQAVPAYLIALAAGDIEFQETGPRTGVYAEGKVVKEAAREFADTESMLKAAEKLFGPYRWDRYDILVLPPSFPVGGMENPRLTFITPTVLAGDKSMVGVIAHELAHSWSGNLVTNATWRDTWLNEGFADYLQSRIMAAVYGQERADMEDVLGVDVLRGELARLKPADQVLAIDLRGRDPGLELSEVPYQKGRLFLRFLETRFGRERFDGFLRGYFDHFAFKSLSTEEFASYLDHNLLEPNPGVVSRDQVREWLYAPGLPADAVLPVSSALQSVDEARAAWLAGKRPASSLGNGWAWQQWQRFLDGIDRPVSAAQLADLDRAQKLTHSQNALIEKSWLVVAIRNDYQPAYPRLEQYLKTIGRQILVEPLYRELMKTPSGTRLAKRVYAKARPAYHSSTAAAIDRIVTPADAEDPE
jgi:aminopeptidase N